MYKSLTILVFFFLLAVQAFPQEANIVPGEVMIQLRPGSSVQVLSSKLDDIDMAPVEMLSDIMNIWLFKYDISKIAAGEVLSRIYANIEVNAAQFNHYVQLRGTTTEAHLPENPFSPFLTMPNDTRFNEQWALNNTGQGGGTPDADIDAPEAWDFATGGMSGLGDSIVVAIVDGGCELTHSDLQYWYNWNEIPGNNIDDDNNGYVDDYRGWNAYNNNGSVPSDGHGTHVSGIAGARGNNALGVAGVNWNVKTMPVAASSGTESVVIKGYGYVLKMRKMYNETNGQYGAFIVATNASFGVDYGNPNNYPLWCAIYDSLGVQGVLSCGATANLNVNVDVVGDIPTACPSPYLVTVTNTTNTDAKNSGAGYGLTTIDLGAPGTGVLATYTGNGYTSLTGTSMATPQVTGVIALMFSAANSALINQYKQFPGPVALQFKNYLLQGTDSITALANITVTGGRLNAFKAVLAVAATPDTVAPQQITDLRVSDTTSNSLTIRWTVPLDTTMGGVTQYDIRKSASPITPSNFNSAEQIIFGSAPSPSGSTEMIVIKNLNFSTTYYFAVKSKDRWGNTSLMSNPASGITFGSPVISVTPSSITRELTPGVLLKDTVRISNVSSYSSTLNFNVALDNNTFPTGYVLTNISPLVIQSDQSADKENQPETRGFSLLGSGGPDYFGYKWIDSDEPSGPQYVWEDIITTGTLLTNWTPVSSFNAKDEGYAGPIPFNFKFYGQQNTHIYPNSNGFLTFTAPTTSSYTNVNIPNASAPNGFIAPFWDDLDGTTHGDVYYKLDGNKLIIQYEDWARYSANTEHFTFQIVLFSSGRVMFYYKTMTGTLNSATIGMENSSGTGGLSIAYNSSYAKNNFAVKIQAEPDWLTGTSLSGMLYNGNTALVELTFRTEDYPLGNYSMDVNVTSNDPVNDSITIPVSLHLVEIPVELSSFSAVGERNNVLLRWTAATETNNLGFRIERAAALETGKTLSYQETGFVKGAGTTTEAASYLFTDKNVPPGKYFYRLKQEDYSGDFSYSPVVEVDLSVPFEFSLSQNYPNPFNPMTTIEYSIPEKSEVKMALYSLMGDKVSDIVNRVEEPGYKKVVFDGSGLASGIYFYTITASSEGNIFRSSRKMVIIK
jgi:subtilisin family serine protease